MKTISMMLAAILVLMGSSVFAQSTLPARSHYGAGGGNGMYPAGMMSKEKIEKFMQSLMEVGLLYKMLEQPTMVSSDNGVIVAYGNTLRKYDKDLNLVKEVDLDVNVDGMQELASKFAKKYSSDIMDLMGGMAGPASVSPAASSSTATASAGPAKSLEDQKEEEIKKEIEQIK